VGQLEENSMVTLSQVADSSSQAATGSNNPDTSRIGKESERRSLK